MTQKIAHAARQHRPLNKSLARLLFLACVVIAWETLARTVLNPNFVSPPSAVLAAMPRILGNPAVLYALWLTLYELALAFALAVIFGLAIGVAVGSNGIVLRRSLPMILLLYSVPQVTILPIFALMFGIGPASKIAFGVSHGIFPIALNVIAGMRSVDRGHLTFARSVGATRIQVLRKIILPHLTPSLFSGLRLCMSATLLGVVLAELYISTAGVGYFTRLFSNTFDSSALFALVVMLGVLAVVFNELVRILETRAQKWTVRDED